MNTQKKLHLSWAMYDWGASAFTTTIMAGFFPVFFKQYYSQGLSVSESTAFLGLSNSIATLFVALFSPLIGFLCDYFFRRKSLLLMFASWASFFCVLLAAVPEGHYMMATLLYVAISVFYAFSFIPYDSILASIVDDKNEDKVSALGYALGYLGGGLLLAVNILMYLKPDLFFMSSPTMAIRWSFASVGVWWFAFTLPVYFSFRESRHDSKVLKGSAVLRASYSSIKEVFFKILKNKPLLYFILGFILYNDALSTVIKMSVDYGLSIGFGAQELLIALLLVQFVGFPATIVLGRVAQKFHPKVSIVFGVCVYMVVMTWAAFMRFQWEFYVVAVLIGLSQGSVQAMSRSYFLRFIKNETQKGEYFSFYNLMGRFSGVLGPLLMAGMAYFTQRPRLSIFALNLLFLPGLFLLMRSKSIKS